MAERRHIRLVTNPAVLVAAEDRRWLASQGYGPEVPLPRRATWYRPDGHALHGLPTDAYHLHLYRMKGMTLRAPVSAAQEPQPRRVSVPSIARQVLSLLGQEERWEGTATELAASLGGNTRTAMGLSRLLHTPKVAAALDAEGITVERGYRGNGRVLRLERRSVA
jgi:hypothetical protein